jgi:hypothetical protein
MACKTSSLVSMVILALCSALAGTIALAQDKSSATTPVALVERVVDGDTVVVNLDGQSVKVRLIGGVERLADHLSERYRLGIPPEVLLVGHMVARVARRPGHCRRVTDGRVPSR